jgi:CsoR family transcriptional regulator, copper-sensing transcriptional repressor
MVEQGHWHGDVHHNDIHSNDIHSDDVRSSGIPSRGYTAAKTDYLKRLRRVEGQVRGLQRMVEEDAYCIDILTQVSAATKALQAVALGLLEDHLEHCVTQAISEGGGNAAVKVQEASAAIARLVRS